MGASNRGSVAQRPTNRLERDAVPNQNFSIPATSCESSAIGTHRHTQDVTLVLHFRNLLTGGGLPNANAVVARPSSKLFSIWQNPNSGCERIANNLPHRCSLSDIPQLMQRSSADRTSISFGAGRELSVFISSKRKGHSSRPN